MPCVFALVETTTEMHMDKDAIWHVIHNEGNQLDTFYDQNAKYM